MHTENGIKIVRMEDTKLDNEKELQTFVFQDEENGAVPKWIKAKRKRFWKVVPCYCGM